MSHIMCIWDCRSQKVPYTQSLLKLIFETKSLFFHTLKSFILENTKLSALYWSTILQVETDSFLVTWLARSANASMKRSFLWIMNFPKLLQSDTLNSWFHSVVVQNILFWVPLINSLAVNNKLMNDL